MGKVGKVWLTDKNANWCGEEGRVKDITARLQKQENKSTINPLPQR